MKRPVRKQTILRRAKRRRGQDTEPEERAPRGLRHHKVKRLNCILTYRKWMTGNNEFEQKRWYVLGAVKVAFMHIHAKGTMKSGNVQVFMNSRLGNGGDWFDSVQLGKAFIISELKKDPTT